MDETFHQKYAARINFKEMDPSLALVIFSLISFTIDRVVKILCLSYLVFLMQNERRIYWTDATFTNWHYRCRHSTSIWNNKDWTRSMAVASDEWTKFGCWMYARRTRRWKKHFGLIQTNGGNWNNLLLFDVDFDKLNNDESDDEFEFIT